MLRRMISKRPALRNCVDRIVSIYNSAEHMGTEGFVLRFGPFGPGPPLGAPKREPWTLKLPTFGPIGLLLYSLHQFGAWLSPNLHICYSNEVCVSIVHTPFQYLQPLVRRLVQLARTSHAKATRADLQQTSEIDFETLRGAISQAPKADRNQVQWLTNLSGWSEAKLHDIDRVCSAACECGYPRRDLFHAAYECPLNAHLRSARAKTKFKGLMNS